MMQTDREILLEHSKRTIRAFLRTATLAEESALWSFVYGGRVAITLRAAQCVAAELELTDKTVGDLLSGWSPEALHPIIGVSKR